MSVKIYKAESLHLLGDKFVADIIEEIKLSKGKWPIDVITPNKAMQSWLDDVLVKKSGVRFNVKYHLPSQFLFNKVRSLAVFKDLSNPLASSREVMNWSIYYLLEEMIKEDTLLKEDKEWFIIKRYLTDASEKKSQQELAKQISQVFDAYQLYRPEMTIEWSNNKNSCSTDWQAYLWNRLKEVNSSGFNDRATLFNKLNESLNDGTIKESINGSLLLFGQPAIPPLFADALVRISTVIYKQLTIYWPCVNDKRPHSSLVNKWSSHQRNTQLVWDKYEAEIEYLHSTKPDVQPSVLQSIRTGEIYENIESSNLSIHICHSPKREVEVCKNEILRILDNDPSLSASDILVMAPDIKPYIPLIESVFRDNEKHSSSLLSYKIRDARDNKSYQIGAIIRFYLTLITTVVTKDQIVSLLHYKSIAAYYNLDLADIHEVAKLFTVTNTKSGLDKDHLNSFGYDFDSLTTWQTFLKKIAIGTLIDENNTIQGQNFESFRLGASNDAIHLLKATFSLLTDIKRDVEFVRLNHSLGEWVDWFKAIVLRYFGSSKTSQIDDKSISNLLEEILNMIAQIPDKFKDKKIIGFELFSAYITENLEKISESSAFISSSITISSMVPMRSIPYKIIYLLGLDQQAFPREIEQPFFDRITYSKEGPKAGDRNRVEDDQQLLVDLLYATNLALHISYNGKSQFSASKVAPSPLINEVIEFIDSNYKSLRYKYEHAIHAYSTSNFTNDNLPSYDHHSFQLANSIKSYKHDKQQKSLADYWFPLNKEKHDSPEKSTEYDLIDLCKIIKDPTKYFVQNKLQAKVKHIDENEEFKFLQIPNGLKKYQIKEALITNFINESNTNKSTLLTDWLKKGKIDNHGIKWVYNELIKDYEESISKIKDLTNVNTEEISVKLFEIFIDNNCIKLSAPFIGKKCIYISASKMKGSSIIAPWFISNFLSLHEEFANEEILVNAFFENKDVPKKYDLIEFKRVNNPSSVLSALINIANEAKEQPVPFFADVNLTMHKNELWTLDEFNKQWEHVEDSYSNSYASKYYNRWVWGDKFHTLYNMQEITSTLFLDYKR